MVIVSTIGYLFMFIEKKSYTSLFGFLATLILLTNYYIQFINYNLDSYKAIGIASSIITGIFGYIYTKFSYKIYKKYDLSASQVLSIRFWLLLILTLSSMFFLDQHIEISFGAIFKLVILGFTVLIIPLYFSQISITNIGPNLTSIIIGVTPVLCFFLEKIFLPTLVLGIHYFNYIIIIMIFITVNLLNWISHKYRIK